MVYCTEDVCIRDDAICYYFKKYVADKEDPGLCQQLTLGLGVGHQNDGANSGCM